MLAFALIALGAAMVWFGYRCAGSPAGFASDHSGAMPVGYPDVPGTARSPVLALAGALVEALGFVVIVFGVAAML